MSIKLSTLVWNAKPLGSVRQSLALGTLLASLADQVDEVRHKDWCYPSLPLIQERTKMSRSSVIRHLKTLQQGGWIRIETRAGYGNVYRFNVEKLSAHQQPRRRVRHPSQADTGSSLTPVSTAQGTGVNSALEGCQLAVPNNEESVLNQHQPANAVSSLLSDTKTEKPRPQPLPEYISPTLWAAFLAMRKESGKPITEPLKFAALATLEQLRSEGHDPNRVLQVTILNRWMSFYTSDNTKSRPAAVSGMPHLSAIEKLRQQQNGQAVQA